MQKTFKALMALVWLCAAPAKAAEEDTLRQLFSYIPAQYVEPITIEQTAVYFLKGISAVDKNLRIGNDVDKISLYYRGGLAKSLRKPQDADDVQGWTELGGKMLDEAMQKSEMARQRDFELVDLMMADAVKNFDKDTKYYSSILPESERAIHRRNFAARMEDDNLYLKIGAFNNFTKEETVKAVKDNPNAKGMILDLRSSPGGQLSAAVEVADLFLDEGIVTSVRGRDTNGITYYNSADGDIFSAKPMVVLIDGETSSAAEMLTAALQEQSRATVVGTKSFGKGTIQNLINLPNGATLSLSSEYFYTPSGKKLAGAGVVPDICTYEMPESKNPEWLIAEGKDNDCGQENREDSGLEPKIAAILLKI